LRKESKEEPKLLEEALRVNSTSWGKLLKLPILKLSKLQMHKNFLRKQINTSRLTQLAGNET